MTKRTDAEKLAAYRGLTHDLLGVLAGALGSLELVADGRGVPSLDHVASLRKRSSDLSNLWAAILHDREFQ